MIKMCNAPLILTINNSCIRRYIMFQRGSKHINELKTDKDRLINKTFFLPPYYCLD